MKKYLLYIILVSLCFLFSCNQSKTFIYSFENTTWDFRDSVVFAFEITDLETDYDLELFFRNTLDYPYRNLYLLIETHYNNTIIQVDTLQYYITDKSGKWMGSGIGKTRDNYFLEENKVFDVAGEYKFMIKHGMRENPLSGSSKIGIKIIRRE